MVRQLPLGHESLHHGHFDRLSRGSAQGERRMRMYVGNLSYRLSESELKQTFSEFGEVSSASIVTDRLTGESKGFGFVEMPSDSEAKAAMQALNGRQIGGRSLRVDEARPREGGGGGGGFGGGGGGGSGGCGGRGGGRGGTGRVG